MPCMAFVVRGPLCSLVHPLTSVSRTEAKSLDLSGEVKEFRDLVTGWDKYDKELRDVCHIAIHHVRRYATCPLPSMSLG
jgi:poly(A) polymerase Pap1